MTSRSLSHVESLEILNISKSSGILNLAEEKRKDERTRDERRNEEEEEEREDEIRLKWRRLDDLRGIRKVKARGDETKEEKSRGEVNEISVCHGISD